MCPWSPAPQQVLAKCLQLRGQGGELSRVALCSVSVCTVTHFHQLDPALGLGGVVFRRIGGHPALRPVFHHHTRCLDTTLWGCTGKWGDLVAQRQLRGEPCTSTPAGPLRCARSCWPRPVPTEFGSSEWERKPQDHSESQKPG